MIVKQRKEKDSHELDFLHKVDDERSKGKSVSVGFLFRSTTHWLLQGPYGVLKSLEFNWTKFKALKSFYFTKQS